MSVANPTPLALGAKGALRGKAYEVIGRIVKGMREEGVTYYWHEFLLLAPDGSIAFLEFEDDEGRAEWKFVVPFASPRSWSPEELETLSNGWRIELDQTDIRVTEVDLATVHQLEGSMPFEIAVGDTMKYLDARKKDRVYSIEWNESRVEYFKGLGLTGQTVAEAFGLTGKFRVWQRRRNQKITRAVAWVVGIFAVWFWGAYYLGSTESSWTGDPSTNSVRHRGFWFRGGGSGWGK